VAVGVGLDLIATVVYPVPVSILAVEAIYQQEEEGGQAELPEGGIEELLVVHGLGEHLGEDDVGLGAGGSFLRTLGTTTTGYRLWRW